MEKEVISILNVSVRRKTKQLDFGFQACFPLSLIIRDNYKKTRMWGTCDY